LEGGKSAYLYEIFHEEWLLTYPDTGYNLALPTGQIIEFPSKQLRWRAVIPGKTTPDERFQFGEEIPVTGFLSPKRAGCEEDRLAILLFAFCFESLMNSGHMLPSGIPTGKPLRARMTAVGEPGGKVRIPTVTEAVAVTYLQPFAHVMRGILMSDPTLRAGLGSADQLYEFVKQNQNRKIPPDYLLLLGDLEDATNHIKYEVGKLHWESFIEDFKDVSNYFRYAPHLVLQSLALEHEDEIYTTYQGAPMGMPGTKIILHTIGKAIDCAAEQLKKARSADELNLSLYRNAGDDIMKLGPLELLQRHRQAALDYKVVPSADKWGVYKYCGLFCEQLASLGGEFVLNPSSVKQSFKIDSIPARLFSSETKLTTGDEDTNPIFGKISSLSKSISWMALSVRQLCLLRSIINYTFRDYGDYKSILGLPVHLGGLGFPIPHLMSFREVPPKIKAYCRAAWLCIGTTKSKNICRALRSISRPLLYERGDPIIEEDNALNDLLLEFLPCYPLDTIIATEELDLGPNPRYWDKVKAVNAIGYINISAILNHGTFRPYWERNMLHIRKGWQTAPLAKRIGRIIKQLSNIEIVQPSFDEWISIIEAPPLDYQPPDLYLRAGFDRLLNVDQGNTFLEGAFPQSINIPQSSTGLSMKMKVPNKSIFWSDKAF